METRDNNRQNIGNNIEQAETMARAEQRKRKNESTRKMNKLWMWLGVVILIFILLFWIFGIGTQEAVDGIDNGVQTTITTGTATPSGE
ncbi:MAG: TMEM208 family protein [Bacteroidales bacterium]|nr:TMEM208 family protein [Bacteroidales bacterium]MBD5189985.1 TMEM208 family protein [Bacteroidales bacterium]MBD5387524.1 TMEM208 family protein [bacterium]MDE6256163.1 hypothetical protein [Muribaculaceae bacterium]